MIRLPKRNLVYYEPGAECIRFISFMHINWKQVWTTGVVAVSFGTTAVMAYAADPYGLDATANQTPFAEAVKAKKTLPQVVGDVISVALSLIGLLFLGLALYGGFKWMTAQGNEKDVQIGRDTLINATIGIILIVSAYVITNFIFTDVVSQINAPSAGPAQK